MKKRVLTEWLGFSKAIGLEAAPETQRREMKRAFYAGAQAFLKVQMLGLEESGSDEPTENDLKLMDDLNAELENFFAEVRAGTK